MRLRVKRSVSNSLPEDVRDDLHLQPGERVLAFATDEAGRIVVATDRDLLLQRQPPAYSRIGWDTIDRATFAQDVLRIECRDVTGSEARIRVRLATPRSLPQVVRDRVTASIVVSQHIPLRGSLGVRVVARRRPGSDALTWSTRFDDELQPVDASLQQRADELAVAARSDLGLDV